MAEHFKAASTCPICHTYLEDPVMLTCGFNCCRRCVPSLQKEPNGVGFVCPFCPVVSQMSDIRPCGQLSRLVSKVRALEPQLTTILQMNPRVRKFQVDMTFDIRTAHENLIFSEDLRRVHSVYLEQKPPVHPESFTQSVCVLGTPRFTAGRHYWEVDVTASATWSLGVCKDSVCRQGVVILSSNLGFWTVTCKGEGLFCTSTEPPMQLLVSPRMQRVGIFLDMDFGIISFYHVDYGSHIFTFPKISVADPLRPFFAPACGAMDGGSFLKLCPSSVPDRSIMLGKSHEALSTENF